MTPSREGPGRPLLRYHGGKWRIAHRIIGVFPAHRIYVEPFGGAASILLRKPRSYAEIYNDAAGDVVALFRVLRGPRANELARAIALTPFARSEFAAAYEDCDDEVETARRMIVRSFMGFGSSGVFGHSTGFRASSNRSGTTPAHDWANFPDALRAIIERLRGVVVEEGEAVAVMRRHDCAEALHYLDPPYVPETRGRGNPYSLKHKYWREMTLDDHRELLDAVTRLRGMVVISGYPHPLYDERLAGWGRMEIGAYADGARPRREVLWLNAAASRAAPAPLLEALS